MTTMELSIVTIKDGVPCVLRNPLAGLSTLDEWREAARRIAASHKDFNTVVFLMEEDGEYPLYRYIRGEEVDWRKKTVKDRARNAIAVIEKCGTVEKDRLIELLRDVLDVLEA